MVALLGAFRPRLALPLAVATTALSFAATLLMPAGGRVDLTWAPTGVAVTGLLVTLAPGSVLIDVDWEAGLILFHMFDASDPAATRGAIERFYERYQRPVFP